MHVRMAVPEDMEAMLSLLKQVGEVHRRIRPDLFKSGAQKYGEEELLAMLADAGRPVFAGCMEEGGPMAGYAMCRLEETPEGPVLFREKTLYIDDLCVDASVRGTGLAAEIYGFAEEFARAAGCGSITLNVWEGNHRAMGFYRKMGMLPRKTTMEKKL